jgi:hypothetical protein
MWPTDRYQKNTGDARAADKPLVMAPAAALPCGEAGLYVLERHTTSHSQ